jgi:hypothetical protein
MSNAAASPALDIFALRDFVVDEYKHFATSRRKSKRSTPRGATGPNR